MSKRAKPIRYAADASSRFVEKFNDESQWKVVPGVPCFDEHEETFDVPTKGPDGKLTKTKQVERFDVNALQKYAANCNALVASGNPPGLTMGHTIDKGTESQQPETLGFGKNYRVAYSPTLQKHVILHDEYYYPDKYEAAKTCPYRSVERWREDEVFKPVALLRREPKRRLGPVMYRADNKTVIRYSVEAEMPDMPDEAPDDAAPAPDAAPPAPAAAAEAPPAPAAAAAPVAPQMEPSAQDKDLFAKLCKYYKVQYADPAAAVAAPPAAPMPAAPPVQMAAMPSGSNVFPPVMEKPPMQMQANADVVRYQKEVEDLRRAREADAQRIAVLEKGERVARYSATFEGMEADGYPIDAAEEVERCQDYSQAEFDQHIADIKKYGDGARRPVGPAIRIGDSPDPMARVAGGKMTADQYDVAMKHMAEKPGTSWPEAMKYAMSGNPVRGVA